MSDTPPSRKEWKKRIAPHLSTSLSEASEAITNTPAIQDWLHAASMEAAMGLKGEADIQAQSLAYSRMLDTLHERFPELVEAVRELTQGCGQLALNWRPLSPQFSTVYIDFGWDLKINVFYALERSAAQEVNAALDTIRAALPKGDPFKGRPNRAVGVLSLDDRCCAVEYKEHAADQGRRRTVTIRLPDRPPIEDLSKEEAAHTLRNLLSPS